MGLDAKGDPIEINSGNICHYCRGLLFTIKTWGWESLCRAHTNSRPRREEKWGALGVCKSLVRPLEETWGVILHFENCVWWFILNTMLQLSHSNVDVPFLEATEGAPRNSQSLWGRESSWKQAVWWSANFPMLQETPVHVPLPPSEDILGIFNVC